VFATLQGSSKCKDCSSDKQKIVTKTETKTVVIEKEKELDEKEMEKRVQQFFNRGSIKHIKESAYELFEAADNDHDGKVTGTVFKTFLGSLSLGVSCSSSFSSHLFPCFSLPCLILDRMFLASFMQNDSQDAIIKLLSLPSMDTEFSVGRFQSGLVGSYLFLLLVLLFLIIFLLLVVAVRLDALRSDSQRIHVFLGGACGTTTWRSEIAIPMFEKNNVTFYNPQVKDWTHHLIVCCAALLCWCSSLLPLARVLVALSFFLSSRYEWLFVVLRSLFFSLSKL
jgi:hypothetical protein